MRVTEETFDDIQQQAVEIVTKGQDPGGIVVSPPRLLTLLAFASQRHAFEHDPRSPCGWSLFGIPVFRCWEIPGPVVVSEAVLKVLLKCERIYYDDSSIIVERLLPSAPPQNPILF